MDRCEICHGVGSHRVGCPYYEVPVVGVCDLCGDDIYSDEDYIEDGDGLKIHYDHTVAEIAGWLNWDINWSN